MNSSFIDETNADRQAAIPRRKLRWLWFAGTGIIVLAVAVAGSYFFTKQTRVAAAHGPIAEKPSGAVTVDVVNPTVGGIERICIQPGTIEPFEAADLYAKVSGFLSEQSVDIGSRVKRGQVLAKIAVPEFEKQVERDIARVEHADAVVKQMRARIRAAEADAKAAEVSIQVAKLLSKAKGAYRKYREKQLNRYKELNAQRAIDAKVVDEAEDQYEASIEAESAAIENIAASEQRLIASQARIDQGQADLDEAKAEVKVAAAELERSRVLVAFSVINSPYDGVVTKRSFNRGDFIRSANAGGDRTPLLAVERTDLMRVVVQVPDRDVPYTDVGDAATVEIDALPGKPIRTAISRVSESEDAATRTMRTEIDVLNSDGKLRRGMYGRVVLRLDAGQPNAITIPSTALTNKTENSRAAVKVVRDGVVRVVPVLVGTDNGIRVEILSGLTANDSVIIRSSGAIEEGKAVEISATKSGR